MFMKPILLSLITCFFLFSCTHLPKQEEPFPATAQNTQLQQWQFKGRIGIRTPTEGFSANIHWQQCNDNFNLHLSGPLGLGSVFIRGNNKQIILQNNQGDHYFPRHNKSLEQALGFTLPFDELFYWIRALAAPNTPFTKTESGFTQAGWALSYSRWQSIEQFQLPEKLKALQNVPEQAHKIVLKINEWQLDLDCKNPS